MAIRIDIPGIGTVTAENAATESTLQALLQVMSTNESRRRQDSANADRELEKTAQAAQMTGAAMSTVAGQTRNVSSEMQQFSQSVNEHFREIGGLGGYAKDSLSRLAGTFALTLTKATTAYATNYKQIAQSPVKASADMLAGAIDLATVAGERVGDLMQKFGLGLMATLTPGGLAFGATLALTGTAMEKLAPVIGSVAKTLNTVFAAELEETIQNFRQLTSSGALFGNGMIEMRVTAHSAGIMVDQFTRGVQAADASVRNIGLSFAGGAQKVSETAQYFTQLGDGSSSLRRQMLNLGYGVEEQISLTADYLASIRAGTTAEQMRTLDYKELARGTRDYAEDLRVLQALTKEDAKQAQENARLASMQADIMAQLDPESAQRFQGVLRSMPAELQKGFLEQLSLGTVVDAATNVYMSQNQAVGEMFNQMEGIIRNSNMTMGEAQDAMLRGRAVIADEQRRLSRDGQVAINQAARAGATGIAASVAEMINGIIAGTLNDPQVVDETRKAAKMMKESRDELTNTVNATVDSAQKFGMQMETLATDYLPTYATALKTVNETMIGMVGGILRLSGGDRYYDEKQGRYIIKEAPTGSIIEYLMNLFGGGTEPAEQKFDGKMIQNGDISTVNRPESVSTTPVMAEAEIARRKFVVDANIDYDKLAVAMKTSMPEFNFSGLETKVDALKAVQEQKSNEIKTVLDESKEVLNKIAKSSSSSADYAGRNYSWNT